MDVARECDSIMECHFNRWRDDESGFTLVEMLSALMVMAVLVAAAAPSISGYLNTARSGAWDADQRSIQAAADAYFSEYRTGGAPAYPTLDGTKAVSTTLGASTGCTLATAATPASGPCIDFAKLTGYAGGGRAYLHGVPQSAGAQNSTTLASQGEMVPGTGSYVWYIGADGQVRSSPPKGEASYP